MTRASGIDLLAAVPGDSELERARDDLFEAIHQDLSSVASALLRRRERHASLHTHDLVGEAVLRLLQSERLVVADRAHLLALAARAMRRVLIDAARRRGAGKRRGEHLTLRTDDGAGGGESFEILRLERALLRLRAIDPDRAVLVELRYYGGLTVEEAATVLNVSPSTVERSWRTARAWLRDAIENDPGDGEFS